MGLEQRLVTQASLSASPAALMVSILRARAAELRPGDQGMRGQVIYLTFPRISDRCILLTNIKLLNCFSTFTS